MLVVAGVAASDCSWTGIRSDSRRSNTERIPSMLMSWTEHGAVCHREGNYRKFAWKVNAIIGPSKPMKPRTVNGWPGHEVAPSGTVRFSSAGVT